MNKYDNLVEKLLKFIIIVEIIGIIILIILNTKVNNDSMPQKSFYENKKINELIPVSPDNELMAKKYFSDFVNLTIYEPKYAYEHVADYYKEKVYPSYEYFKNNILKNASDGFKTSSVASYKVTEKNKYRVFYIKDSSGQEYLIKEEGIMNYKIYLDIKNTDL